VCAAIARQAQKAGRRVSRAKEWAELQACTNGRSGQIELILYERMNGNGELTETENVIFLRKLQSSYKILTDERNSCVLCYGNGGGNGYGTLEISHVSAFRTHLPLSRLAHQAALVMM